MDLDLKKVVERNEAVVNVVNDICKGLDTGSNGVAGLFLYTYIHNWPLQPFSQDYGLVSHTTHV